MSSLKCDLACSVAGNQDQKGLTAYTQLARTLNSPMDTCGEDTRVQLRASAHEAVKTLIPRKMETPGLTMRMGADALGRADHEDFSMLIGERFFISGNSEPLFYSVKRVYLN